MLGPCAAAKNWGLGDGIERLRVQGQWNGRPRGWETPASPTPPIVASYGSPEHLCLGSVSARLWAPCDSSLPFLCTPVGLGTLLGQGRDLILSMGFPG